MTNKNYILLENVDNNKDKKVLLVYPKTGSEAKKVSLYPPLSSLYLASNLKEYPLAIFDQRVDNLDKFIKLLDENPICVGFSIMTGPQIKYALDLAELVKKRSIPTVFGGVHATILPNQTLQNDLVNYVVLGNGEITFRKLIEDIYNNCTNENLLPGERLKLKNFPTLPYELVDVENYVHSAALPGRALPFLFSRGCPFQCTFCCNPVISERKWDTMDIQTASKQVKDIVNRYNLDGIIFWDENLTVNPKILNEFAKNINNQFQWYAQTRSNSLLSYDLKFLQKMGAKRFSCGLESGSNKILNLMKKEETVEEYIEVNKRLAKTNISVWYNYIMGHPEEKIDDLNDTLQLALNMLDNNPNANNSTFYLLVPYPGTQVANKYISNTQLPQSLREWADFGRHNFTSSWHNEKMLNLYSKIYFSSKFVGGRIISLFPNDNELMEISLEMTNKWRNFDFYNEGEWDLLKNRGWKVLKILFGENAY